MTLPTQGPGGANNGTGPGGNGATDAQQPAPINAVPVGPVPMNFNVGQAQLSDARVWCFLQIHSAIGVQHCFLPPAAAVALGKELQRVGEAGQLLITPQTPLLGG